tara:strand:- start:16270 stop:16734 length:465 start_codon:yes stop_codon:yes gene_type:complete
MSLRDMSRELKAFLYFAHRHLFEKVRTSVQIAGALNPPSLSPQCEGVRIMQVKATAIHVVLPDGKSHTYTDSQVLMSDWGIYIKDGEDKLILVTWEKVNSIEWNDVKTIQRVWAEAVLETLEDMMDFDELEEDEELDEVVKNDDPEVNPYSDAE